MLHWGHVDDRHRVNEGLARPQCNLIMTADARMFRTAPDAALHHLSTRAQKADLAFEFHINQDGTQRQSKADSKVFVDDIPETANPEEKARL
eukprot:429615-Pyramimonas_sp.AAC.1